MIVGAQWHLMVTAMTRSGRGCFHRDSTFREIRVSGVASVGEVRRTLLKGDPGASPAGDHGRTEIGPLFLFVSCSLFCALNANSISMLDGFLLACEDFQRFKDAS